MATGISMDRGKASGGRSNTVAIRLQRVPIEHILDIEFQALETTKADANRIKSKYEARTALLMREAEGIALKGQKSGIKHGRLSNVEEGSIFRAMHWALNSKIGARYEQNQLVSTSVDSGKFNCYSSGVQIADALTRLGRPVNAVFTIDHMLLAGSGLALETAGETVEYVFGRDRLEVKYPYREETDMGSLVAVAHTYAGMVLKRNGHYASALKMDLKAVELYPKFASGWFNIGRDLSLMGRHMDALNAFNSAAQIFPEDAVLLGNIGNEFYRIGNADVALKAYNAALSLENRNIPVLCNKGIVLHSLGRDDEAEAVLRIAVEANPEYRNAWQALGNVLMRKGRDKEADECFVKLVRQ